jgi:hypothetical protein
MSELYDLINDPLEYNNLTDGQRESELAANLSERLSAGWQQAQPQ